MAQKWLESIVRCGTERGCVRVEEQAVEGNDPQVEVRSKYVREKQLCVRTSEGSHGVVVIYCVSGGYLLSLSTCRWGFQGLLKGKPSSTNIIPGVCKKTIHLRHPQHELLPTREAQILYNRRKHGWVGVDVFRDVMQCSHHFT